MVCKRLNNTHHARKSNKGTLVRVNVNYDYYLLSNNTHYPLLSISFTKWLYTIVLLLDWDVLRTDWEDSEETLREVHPQHRLQEAQGRYLVRRSSHRERQPHPRTLLDAGSPILPSVQPHSETCAQDPLEESILQPCRDLLGVHAGSGQSPP